jgi:hypothetical protein
MDNGSRSKEEIELLRNQLSALANKAKEVDHPEILNDEIGKILSRLDIADFEKDYYKFQDTVNAESISRDASFNVRKKGLTKDDFEVEVHRILYYEYLHKIIEIKLPYSEEEKEEKAAKFREEFKRRVRQTAKRRLNKEIGSESESSNKISKEKLIAKYPFTDKRKPEKLAKVKKSDILPDEKISFMTGLLKASAKSDVNDGTREKLVNLIGQELEKTGSTEKEILERLKKIENSINNISTGEGEGNTPPPNSDLPKKYINPKNLSDFLLAYNQDPVLKYTCHEIDDNDVINEINKECGTSEYNLVEHQKIIEKRFIGLVDKRFISHHIKNLILVYLTGKSYTGSYNLWSSERISINWNSPEILEWSIQNPGLVPNPGINIVRKNKNKGFTFKKAFPSSLMGVRINSFTKLVLHFKHLTHIRADNSLLKIILRINETEGWNKKINFKVTADKFSENIELFTDVDKLIQAYNDLIKIILDVSEKGSLNMPKVELEFKEKNSDVYFIIHHTNSIYQHTVADTIKRVGTGYTDLIKYKINGLCNFHVKADFGNGRFAEINIWDGEERKERKVSQFDGVEYRLIFKK